MSMSANLHDVKKAEAWDLPSASSLRLTNGDNCSFTVFMPYDTAVADGCEVGDGYGVPIGGGGGGGCHAGTCTLGSPQPMDGFALSLFCCIQSWTNQS